MVRVTEQAAVLLARSLEQEEMEEGQAIRLIRQEDSLALTVDEQREEDQVIEHDGKPILLVDPQVGEMLGDVTVDAVVQPDGARLVLRKD